MPSREKNYSVDFFKLIKNINTSSRVTNFKKMSAPFKAPRKVQVTIPEKDKALDFQKKMFSDSAKKLVEGFVAGHVPYSSFLCNIGNFAEIYCHQTGRSDEVHVWEDDQDDTDEMEDDENENFIEKKYPNNQEQSQETDFN